MWKPRSVTHWVCESHRREDNRDFARRDFRENAAQSAGCSSRTTKRAVRKDGALLVLACHLKLPFVMGYIPENARWYLADIVVEHKIEDDDRNVIHINTILVRANSPERAYERALKFGQESEMEYLNPNDKMVRVVFRGLRDLNVIHDGLRSGSELNYEERIGLTEARVAKLISPKKELGVFADRVPPSRDKPNYMPKNVMEGLREFGFDDDDIYEKP